jgi:hypothetical protein
VLLLSVPNRIRGCACVKCVILKLEPRLCDVFVVILWHLVGLDCPIGIVMGYGLDGRDSIPGRDKTFSLLHNVQTGSGAQPASYPMGTAGE